MPNRNTLVLWFVAPSCHGKTKTISDMLDDDEHVMNSQLSTEDRAVVQANPSSDRPDDLTDTIKERIEECITGESDCAILVDWQYNEREHRTIEKVVNEYETVDHQIVFLACDLDEVVRRCRGRGEERWEEEYTREQAESHLREISQYISRINTELDLTVKCFDTSRGYEECDWREEAIL